jgi:hypothetical protein
MIVKIYKTIGLRTFLTSIFLIIYTVLFSFYLEKNDGVSYLDQWAEITVRVILMAAFVLMITLLEIQIKGRKFDDIHLIAFPTIFILFSSTYDLKITPIL